MNVCHNILYVLTHAWKRCYRVKRAHVVYVNYINKCFYHYSLNMDGCPTRFDLFSCSWYTKLDTFYCWYVMEEGKFVWCQWIGRQGQSK